MRIDEAISLLKQYIDYDNPDVPDFYTMEEACEVVIKTLEQEPCEDCVSRQAVLEAIDVKAWEFCDYLIRNGRNDEQKPVSHFADNLRECVGEDLPPVTPQPKMGYWVRMSDLSEDADDRYKCSKCGNVVHSTDRINLYTFHRWCGRCGSNNDVTKMQEVEND